MKHKFTPIEALVRWASVRGHGLLLAGALGVSPPTVSDWVTGKKRIPLDKVMPIETFTKGSVNRRHMRPNDYLVHWPELAKTHETPASQAIKDIAKTIGAAEPFVIGKGLGGVVTRVWQQGDKPELAEPAREGV